MRKFIHSPAASRNGGLRASALLVAVAWALAILAAPAGAGQSSVLSWPDVSGSAGGRMRLTLSIADADSVQSGLFEVKYDPSLISPITTSLQQESFGQTISTLWGASTPADSTLRFVFATGDPAGYVGGGPWVSIEFDLVDPGLSPLRFADITLEHLPNTILPAVGVDGSISVTPAAVSPSTWGLVKGMYGDEGIGTSHGLSPNRAAH
jgi:hypothetical protein